ncbi:MAG: ABC transporter permease [Firmicutes bacterium]|nr:ABC transporter permease [Bacillota bacterium]
MISILTNELRRTRFGLLIWSALAGLIIFFGVLEYPALRGIMSSAGPGALEQALAGIPATGQLLFGVYRVDFSQPMGYYIVMYYWTGLIVFVHAMYTGASIISKESRDRTAEFIFTKPVKRSGIVRAKTLAGLISILAVGVTVILLSALGMLPVTRDPGFYRQITVIGAGMLLTQGVLLALGLLCGAVFRTYRLAVSAAMLLLGLSYGLLFAAQYYASLYFLSPLAYFEISRTAANGLDSRYVLLAVAVIALCLFITLRLYRRKALVV